ncbi:MAG: hypothetical protein V7K55_09535 [Nostoc sp.]|uniref:hypothetical protein n=1 Tax=Nostoc sp. TaxID=1180 RepID=UPI002FFD03E5
MKVRKVTGKFDIHKGKTLTIVENKFIGGFFCGYIPAEITNVIVQTCRQSSALAQPNPGIA